MIDFIAYAFIPTRRVYLLPWLALRKSWQENGKEWRERYGVIRAHNNTYDTLCVPVPINALVNSMNRALRVDVP